LLLGELLRWNESRQEAETGAASFLPLERPAEDLDFAGSQAQEDDTANHPGDGHRGHGHQLVDAELLPHNKVVLARKDHAAQQLLVSIKYVHSELYRSTTWGASLHGASSSRTRRTGDIEAGVQGSVKKRLPALYKPFCGFEDMNI